MTDSAVCGILDPATLALASSQSCTSFASCPPQSSSNVTSPSLPLLSSPPPITASVRTESDLVAALRNQSVSTIYLGSDIYLTTQHTYAAILPHVQRPLSIVGQCGAAPCALDASGVAPGQYSRILRVDLAGSLTLVSVALRGATCGDGGCAVFVDSDSLIRLYSCVIANNTYSPALVSYGTTQSACTTGGVCSLPVADIRDTTFVNNSGVNGGALALMGSGMPMGGLGSSYALLRLTFTGNTATQSGGAAFVQNFNYYYMPGGNTYALLFVSCAFAGNVAGTSGGAVASNYGRVAAYNSSFVGNTALTGDGGAVWSSAAVVLVSSLFTGNAAPGTSTYYTGSYGVTSSGRGGAVFSFTYDTSGAIGSCLFSNNTAGGTGGGVYFAPYVFTGSNSNYGQAGGLLIRNATFVGNSARDGGAVAVEGYTRVVVQGSVFTANTATGSAVTNNGNYGGPPGQPDFSIIPSSSNMVVVDALTSAVDPTGSTFVNATSCLNFNMAAGFSASGAPSGTGVPVSSYNFTVMANQISGACDYGRVGSGLLSSPGCGPGGSQLSLSAVTITLINVQVLRLPNIV